MPLTIRCGLLAVLCFAAAFAHGLTAEVSQTFPLTDTIYGPASGVGKLRSDGRHPVFFWLDEDHDRVSVTRIDGEERVAKLVFPFSVYDDGAFDAVWTGSHFLVVTQNPGYELIGQLVDSSGDAVGQPVSLAQNALWPRLAFNGKNVLLLYNSDGVRTQLLTPSGAPVGEPRLLEQALLSWNELHLASNGDTFAAIVPQGSSTPQSLYVLDAAGNTVARQTLDTPPISEWALTSNGSRYLAVSAHSSASAAYLFEGNGTLVRTVDLQPTAGSQRSYRQPAATWTGMRWLFSLYVENGSFTRLFELDADGGDLDVLTDRTGIRQMQLTTAGGQPAATWHQVPLGVFAGAPLEESTRRALFAARHQNFLAAATSSTGTLFIWQDQEYWRGALRAGFRTHDGRWTERELATGFAYALAASDGNGFVVVTSHGVNGNRIIRLDANANPIPGGTETFTAFEPFAIASNGNGYVIAGMRLSDFIPTGNLLAAAITGSTVLPARELPFEAAEVVGTDLASDGQRYLLSWGVKDACSPQVQFCGAARIAGMFLTDSANVDGPLLGLTEAEYSGEHDLEWNGHEYVLVRSADDLIASHITREGVTRDQHVLTTAFAGNISAVPAAEGEVAVAWISDAGAFLSIVNEDGADAPLLLDDDRRNFPWPGARLAGIGQGRFAFVFTATVDTAPIHGRSHVMTKIIAPALPPLPPAPVLQVQDLGATINLQWTGSALADGYRVEQRIGDGPWVEVGGWRNADERHLTVRTSASPQFRVRAFNEAGAGPYGSSGGRRRAVR